MIQFIKKLNLIKSASFDNTGLLNKLAISLAIVNSIGHTRALAQIWKEFLNELRFRYDSVCLIPNLLTTSTTQTTAEIVAVPDLSRCLMQQKLQLLNCCINKRLERQMYEMNLKKDKNAVLDQTVDLTVEDEDNDEFYDCEEQVAEGRLKPFGNLKLINKPNEPLYVPMTQVRIDRVLFFLRFLRTYKLVYLKEPTPMTEDMLEQHATVLFNLGSDGDASLLRAKIQSASLLSDMQSFKVEINSSSIYPYIYL